MPPQLTLDKRTIRLIFIAFVLLTGLTAHRLFFAELPHGSRVLVIDGETMGTTYQIRIAGGGLDEALRAEIERETERRLTEVDRWMSNWNPDSEISRFNAHSGTDEFDVSYATADVIAFAIELNKRTSAAFDITIGPVVSLWGFGQGARIGKPPDQAEIDRLLRHTGARMLHVGRGNPRDGGFLAKESPEVKVDLSAIAKGYGVDHVARGLRLLGREDFLVEIGGEVHASGERPGGGPWRVAIEQPREEERALQTTIELDDMSMATSGDYRIFYRENDRRISHTIDPRTGRPVENGPASATVVHPHAAAADAWATALMVMGREGLQLAERAGIGAMLMWRDAKGDVSLEPNSLFPQTRDDAMN